MLTAGCASSARLTTRGYMPDDFGATSTHTRSFAGTEAQTCEAARRALLSQGYLVTAANGELVTGSKNFQPDPEMHVEVDFRVVCARQEGGAPGTLAFATAVQDRYGLKKANSSASVGVGVLGSVSLPFASSDDAMVKVASETIGDERFYERFFALVERYLAPVLAEPAPPPAAPQKAAEVKAPAPTAAGKEAQDAPVAASAAAPVAAPGATPTPTPAPAPIAAPTAENAPAAADAPPPSPAPAESAPAAPAPTAVSPAAPAAAPAAPVIVPLAATPERG